MADAVAGDFKRARLGSVSTGNVERASFCNNNNNNNPQESQKNCGETEASAAHKMPTAETEDSCQGNGCGSQTGCCCCCAGGRENNSQRKGPPHLRVGLLGCGWFSRRAHVPALLKLERRSAHSLGLSLQIEAICSRSQASLDAVSKLLNDGKRRRDIRQYTSQSAFLADPAVDVVIVALPIPIQCAAIEAAWKAGKHVISEKPAASSVAAAARLWAAMQEDLSEKGGGCAGKMWCVLENWAYKPGVSRVSKLLRAGSVGEVARYAAVLRRVLPSNQHNTSGSSAWRSTAEDSYTGGHFLDVGVHIVRALRQWFGEIVAVKATSWHTNSSCSFIRADIAHEGPGGAGGIQGQLELHFKEMQPSAEDGEQPQGSQVQAGKEWEAASGIVVHGIAGQSFKWKFSPSELSGDGANGKTRKKKIRKDRSLEKNVPGVIEHINGDSWVTGGVREALVDALQRCAAPEVPRKHLCSASEALKDAAVIYALAESRDSDGQTVRVESTFVSRISSRCVGRHNVPGTKCHRPRFECFVRGAADIARAMRHVNSSRSLSSNSTSQSESLCVRAVGSCHSWTSVQEAPFGLRIETQLMDRINWCRPFHARSDRHAPKGSAVVSVEPGLLLRDLIQALAARGLTLPSLPMLLDQTIGGAISTGSHGSSMHHGTIADSVVGVALVNMRGSLIELREENAQLQAARAALGQIGVLTSIELVVVPEYFVRRVVRPLTEVQLLEKEQCAKTASSYSSHSLTAMFGRFEHQWIHWCVDPTQPTESSANAIDNSSSDFFPPQVLAICLERVAANTVGAAAYNGQSWFSATSIDGLPLENSLDKWWLGGMRRRPASHGAASNKAQPSASVSSKPSHGGAATTKSIHEDVPSSNFQPQVSAQYSFPLSSFAQVAEELRRAIHGAELESRRPVVIEIKFLSRAEQRTFCAPNALVQPCHRTLTKTPKRIEPENVVVCFNLLWRCSPKDPLLVAVQQTLESLGGLPHPGKLHLPVPAAHPRPLPDFFSAIDCIRTASQPRVGISVMLPAYNAMPWLPIAIRDVLRQTGPIAIELLVVDDGSSDGTHDFLVNLVAALGPLRACLECSSSTTAISSSDLTTEVPDTKSSNPAALMADRGSAADICVTDATSVPDKEAAIMARPLSPVEVAAEALPQHTLRVLWHPGRVNRGMGAAMSLALLRARHDIIGHMESDDERASDSYSRLLQEGLQAHPTWNGACCTANCIGWDRPGMTRYMEWQNSLRSTADLFEARFLEIPSLMQTGLFQRSAVLAATAGLGGRFRDDERWAVDSHFWLEFFAAGMACGKLPDPPMFFWRQHPGQQTRRHGRLSIENLRRCKCDFLVGPQGWTTHGCLPPCAGLEVEVWSMGATLAGWVNDLKSAASVVQEAAGSHPVRSGARKPDCRSPNASTMTPTTADAALGVYRSASGCGAEDSSRTAFSLASLPPPRSIKGVEWKPGRPLPKGWQEPKKEGRKARKKRLKKEAEERRLLGESICELGSNNPQVCGTPQPESQGDVRVECVRERVQDSSVMHQSQPTKACLCKFTRQGKVRLFAFGMDRARKRILQQLGDGWCPIHDIFVS